LLPIFFSQTIEAALKLILTKIRVYILTMAGGTTHHCPKKSKGGCRKGKTAKGFPYCPEHQTFCTAKGKERKHLKTEKCGICA
jgi:hypothetical protein